MTNHAPLDEPIRQILDTYNPVEIKDILLHGSWRKATKHKDWDKVLGYYQENADYMHHYLLDSPDAWNHYGMGHKWNLHSRPRKEIEDEVLAIELKIRKDSLGLIDGGKS
jgi:hypothetical protein